MPKYTNEYRKPYLSRPLLFEQIKKHFKSACEGLTAEALAELTGADIEDIQSIRNNHKSPRATVFRISDWLHALGFEVVIEIRKREDNGNLKD